MAGNQWLQTLNWLAAMRSSSTDTGNSPMASAVLTCNVGNIYIKAMETPWNLEGSFLQTNKETSLWEVHVLRDERGVCLIRLHLGRKQNWFSTQYFCKPLFLQSHHQARLLVPHVWPNKQLTALRNDNVSLSQVPIHFQCF